MDEIAIDNNAWRFSGLMGTSGPQLHFPGYMLIFYQALRGCLEITILGQSFEHNAGRGDVNPGLVRAGMPLVALAQAARGR